MTSRFASPYVSGSRHGRMTSRTGRRVIRRAARRRACRRMSGSIGALVVGLSVVAAGFSSYPTAVPTPAGAAPAPMRGSELTDLSRVELADAQRSVTSARPVEGVLLTHAATLAEQARIAAAVEAARAAKLARRTNVDWDGIAECETGGNWSMQGSSYSGGVGFANTTWSGYGGGEFAPNAGQASREEQIVVAERVHAEHGLSGWGCKAYG